MYSVEVTDENDIKRKYKIKMTGKDAKEIETEQIETSIPSDLNKSNVSNVNINYNLPAKTSTKEKNLYSEFLKNYMNAVVEI